MDENIRFENCSKYNQELYFWYTGVDEANPFNSKLILELFTSRPYKKLYIKEFGYENNGKKKVIIKNKNYILPINVKVDKLPIYDYSWRTANDYYIIEISPWKKYRGLRQMPSVNWSKVFPDKKLGDKFPFQMKVVYQFDDESEKTFIFDYEVEVKEYYWINPLVKMLFW
ncbi:MAG: hypothetical protein MJ215_03645 [Spirochaetia bacterium]|nr:hypothetical protein [Spirochaetia bacterium]